MSADLPGRTATGVWCSGDECLALLAGRAAACWLDRRERRGPYRAVLRGLHRVLRRAVATRQDCDMSRRLAAVGLIGWSVVLGTAAWVYRHIGPPIPARPRTPSCCPHD